MNVKYSKLLKPLEHDCKLYCKDYGTCQRTECKRMKMFDIWHDGIYMGEEFTSHKVNNKMKWERWHEEADCKLNNDRFTRRILAK